MTTQPLRTELANAYQDSFMKPELFHGEYVEIDGDNGSIIVPIEHITISLQDGAESEYEDLSEDDMENVAQAYQNHFAGNAEVYDVAVKTGYIHRLSASGYMDCTDYSASETEEEAIQELLSLVE